MPKRFVLLARAAVFVLVVLVGYSPASADPIVVVVPSHLADADGNVSNVYPFSRFRQTVRYQQVFAASQFPFAPLMISQISFRPGGPYPFSEATIGLTTMESIQFNLSTTSRAPGGLSPTFQENVGADDVTVFAGALALSSAATGPPGGPFDFDITVDITDFLFDPRAGSLLLDIRSFSTGISSANVPDFDAHWAELEPDIAPLTSRAYADNVNERVGNVDTVGLVTQFSIVATETPTVPEPMTLVLFGTGLVGIGVNAWKGRRQL
jgi:hypothetical protein